MAIKTGITSGTPSKIAFGAGVFFYGVTYSELVAPTETEIKAGIIGATQEGGKITFTPKFFEPDIDGKLVSTKEFRTKVGETATMEASFIEINETQIAKAVIGLIGNSTDTNYDVVTSSAALASGHHYSGFGFYGELLDGRPFIVVFKNAICTSGLALETKNGENAKFAGTFECESDVVTGVSKLPYALFIRKKTGWTAVPPDEIDSRTSGSGGSSGGGVQS